MGHLSSVGVDWLERMRGVPNLRWPMGARKPDLDEYERGIERYSEEDRP